MAIHGNYGDTEAAILRALSSGIELSDRHVANRIGCHRSNARITLGKLMERGVVVRVGQGTKYSVYRYKLAPQPDAQAQAGETPSPLPATGGGS